MNVGAFLLGSRKFFKSIIAIRFMDKRNIALLGIGAALIGAGLYLAFRHLKIGATASPSPASPSPTSSPVGSACPVPVTTAPTTPTSSQPIIPLQQVNGFTALNNDLLNPI